jgi:hypothetical protein
VDDWSDPDLVRIQVLLVRVRAARERLNALVARIEATRQSAERHTTAVREHAARSFIKKWGDPTQR